MEGERPREPPEDGVILYGSRHAAPAIRESGGDARLRYRVPAERPDVLLFGSQSAVLVLCLLL